MQLNVEVKTGTEKLGKLEVDYANLLEQLKFLSDLKDVLKGEIIEQFELLFGHKNAKWLNAETGGELQRVIAVTTKFDEVAMRQLLTKTEWETIKKEGVDREKYKAAVKVGLIDEAKTLQAIEQNEEERISHKGGKI